MFVRNLKHNNGKTYVQVVSKAFGRYKVLKSFGSCQSSDELELLHNKANHWIKSEQGISELDFENEISIYSQLVANITSLKLSGIDLVLGKIFDEIGFNIIEDNLFKDLVLYRLVYPKSKLKTTEYLYRFSQKQYTEDDIYRYLDKLHSKQKEIIQQISFDHTKAILGKQINVLFYDVTTIYFE
ncbi:MAG TPA: transposase, partial [Flavobacterium sp.]|nr:transposase [Flavobacterium sp.]